MSKSIGYLLVYCIINVNYRYKGSNYFLFNKEKPVIFHKKNFFNIQNTRLYK